MKNRLNIGSNIFGSVALKKPLNISYGCVALMGKLGHQLRIGLNIFAVVQASRVALQELAQVFGNMIKRPSGHFKPMV